ncbi:MAG TPA: PP2C family protein-serine/threonine phosphatase [Acidobacteriaceae bacterium]|nr:PP2C family protein-serine/threonine phosphatase [Acidobacteriaceae bacterium]
MVAPDPQLARSAVLRVFNHAQIYLFLGAAITTIGFLAACFSLLRRRFDPLLLWFALFAGLYGIRLWMNYQLLWGLGLRPPIFQRIVMAIGFLVPVPAVFFFRSLKLLGRASRLAVNLVWPVVSGLALATIVIGPRDIFQFVNNGLVTAALIVFVIEFAITGSGSRDAILIRRGLFLFVACALYDNITGIFGHYNNIEPFGLVILLASLGVVAGRRALANEQQLTLIQRELEIAQRIQLSILPSAFPHSRSFRVAARYLPMTSVAGDFYDFLLTNDHEAGLLIADVSGHGIPAALIASMVKVAAATQRAEAGRPSELLSGINNVLCGNTQSQFVTAGYVYLNASLKELRYSAAAHPPMLLLRNGEITEITENGLMLAAFDFADYTTRTHPIEPGDRLVLYTDGLLEAENVDGEQFGPGRLHARIRETANLSGSEAADQIISSVQGWSSTQNDDLTILLCDYMTDTRSIDR